MARMLRDSSWSRSEIEAWAPGSRSWTAPTSAVNSASAAAQVAWSSDPVADSSNAIKAQTSHGWGACSGPLWFPDALVSAVRPAATGPPGTLRAVDVFLAEVALAWQARRSTNETHKPTS